MNNTSSVKRILVQTVGTGGENNPVWEALAFTIHERRPDLVVWCCSQQTQEQTIPKLKRQLRKNPPSDWAAPGDLPASPDRRDAVEAILAAHTRVQVCQNPYNAEQLYAEYTRLIDELRRSHPQAELEVDYTSGTKAMSAAVMLAGVARAAHMLHYAVGPTDPSGRATATERLISVSPDTAVVDRQLEELGRLFNLGQFDAVREQLAAMRHRAQESRRFQQLSSLEILAQAYALWSRFDWSAALGRLQHAAGKDSIREAGWDLEQLRRQVEHLRRCNMRWNSPERLADLLAHADRCIETGRYDDGVARLYRLTEYIGQVRFAARFDLQDSPTPTSKVPLTHIAEHAPDTAQRLTAEKRPKDGKVDLGLYDTMCVLAEAGDEIGRLMKAQYDPPDPNRPQKKGPLGRWLDRRNESLLAHGTQPVGEEAARELRALVAEILKSHLAGEGLKLADLLGAARFLTCPWADSGR